MWAEVLIDLDITSLPYEVHYVLDLLEYVGFDTSTLDQQHIYDYLSAVDYTDFVLDLTACEDFFAEFDIDSSTFNQTAWEEVQAELEIIWLPYDVHTILDILGAIGYDTSALSQT